MVQEFYVLKCVDCNIYQVNIVKKSKKWSCVVCSRKQSVVTVYFSGSSKECRKQAQKLNRINIERETISNSETDYCVLELSEENDFVVEENDGEKNSKWNKYIDLTDKCDNKTVASALDAEESEIIIVNEDTLLDYNEKEEILEEDPLLCLEEEINTTDNEGTDASFILHHGFDDNSVVVISSLSFFEHLEPDEIINEVVPAEEVEKKLPDNDVLSITDGKDREKKLDDNDEIVKNGVDFSIPDEDERFYINEFNLEGYRSDDNDVHVETAPSSSVDANESNNNDQLKMKNERDLSLDNALKYEIVEVFEHSSPPPTKIRKQFNDEYVVSISDIDDNEESRTTTNCASVNDDSRPFETRNQTELTKQRSGCLIENVVISDKKNDCSPAAEVDKNSAAATIRDKKSLHLEVDDVSKYNVKVIIPNAVKENGLNCASSSRAGLKTAKETLLKTNLTRSKLRRLIEDIPSLPLIKHPTTCSEECLALIDKEFPLDDTSDDEEYRPASYHRSEKAVEENDGCEVADIGNTNELVREKRTSANSSVNDDAQNSQNDTTRSAAASEQDEKNQNNNVCHRTRSKLPLENTPIELIEHSFVFPDITTDMYETECDDTEWVNFLKQFAEPINSAEPDANDDEATDDPEFVIDETGSSRQVEEDDVEELRNDSSVKISKKELEDLLHGLFEDNTTPVNNGSVADYEIDENEDDDAHDCTINDLSKPGFSDALGSLSVRKVNVVTSAFTVAQLELLKQQIRQHVQLNTQHFVQCYKHPVWCKVADKFESMLNDFKYLSFNSSNSCYNALNLSHAFTFIESWKDYVKNKDDYYFRQHKFKFDTRMMMMICSAESLFLYPLLLPTRPPLWQRNLYIENVLTEPEEKLISLALEEFADFVFEQNLLNTESDNTVTATTAVIATSSGGRSSAFLDLQNLSGIVKLIKEHLMPFRSVLSLEDYIKEKHRSKSMNPIKYYFVHRKAYPVVNYVIPMTASSLRALWYQPEQLLTTVWKHFVQEQKSVKPITRTIPILPK